MIEGFGRIDILVNNAGIGGPRTQRLHELALDDFDAVMAANLRAPLALTQAALPLMIGQGGGAIVNLASPAGFHAVPRVGPYSISKAGMVMLTRSEEHTSELQSLMRISYADFFSKIKILTH